MSNKLLRISASGGIEEINTVATGGAPSANSIPRLDSNGRFDAAMMPTGIGADTATIQASENLAAGDFVNVHDVTGAARVRKADASNARQAHGFVLASVTSGQNAVVYFEGQNTALTSLTIGARYFLSASTAGQASTAVPTTAGHILQELGVAVSASALATEIESPIVRS